MTVLLSHPLYAAHTKDYQTVRSAVETFKAALMRNFQLTHVYVDPDAMSLTLRLGSEQRMADLRSHPHKLLVFLLSFARPGTTSLFEGLKNKEDLFIEL